MSGFPNIPSSPQHPNQAGPSGVSPSDKAKKNSPIKKQLKKAFQKATRLRARPSKKKRTVKKEPTPSSLKEFKQLFTLPINKHSEKDKLGYIRLFEKVLTLPGYGSDPASLLTQLRTQTMRREEQLEIVKEILTKLATNPVLKETYENVIFISTLETYYSTLDLWKNPEDKQLVQILETVNHILIESSAISSGSLYMKENPVYQFQRATLLDAHSDQSRIEQLKEVYLSALGKQPPRI